MCNEGKSAATTYLEETISTEWKKEARNWKILIEDKSEKMGYQSKCHINFFLSYTLSSARQV